MLDFFLVSAGVPAGGKKRGKAAKAKRRVRRKGRFAGAPTGGGGPWRYVVSEQKRGRRFMTRGGEKVFMPFF